MVTRRQLLAGALLARAAGAGGAELAFRREMARRGAARAGVPTRSVPTRHGPLEVAEAGTGRPVLVLHGTGGFDQALGFAGWLAEGGRRVIAPSRYGYLGSAPPPAPLPEAEADGLADLLAARAGGLAAVIGGSAGALPAVALALRHPARVSALVLAVPAIRPPGSPPVAPWSRAEELAARALLGSDRLFWAVRRLRPDLLLGTLLATDPALLRGAAPDEAARVAAVLDGLMPVSAKRAGLLADGAVAAAPFGPDRGAVRAPALLLSCADDRYLTASGARHAAERLPGAELVIWPTGGHVWIGREAELRARIAAFLDRAGA